MTSNAETFTTRSVTYACGCTAGGDNIAAHCPFCGDPIAVTSDGVFPSQGCHKATATPTQPLAGAELPTEREALLGDIEWLLAEGRKIATDEAPDEGRHFDHKFQAIRRLMTGQTVGISLRYLERIIAALKATPPAPPEARPLTISDDLSDLLFRRCGMSQEDTLTLAEEIMAMAQAPPEAAEAQGKAFLPPPPSDSDAWYVKSIRELTAMLRAADARTKALEEQLAAPGTTTIAERQKWFDLKERLAKLESDRECREQYIEELQTERDALKAEVERLRRELGEAKADVERIVVTEGCDAGVVLLSYEGPTHYDPELKMQVYDHEHFSPLGDALVALHKRLSSLVGA